jgi:hypothetical protein
MSIDDMDRIVGAARRRLRESNLRVVCLESRIAELAKHYTEIGHLLTTDPSTLCQAPDGHLSVQGMREGSELIHPEERNLLDTLNQYRDAKNEQASAENDWKRLDSC